MKRRAATRLAFGLCVLAFGVSELAFGVGCAHGSSGSVPATWSSSAVRPDGETAYGSGPYAGVAPAAFNYEEAMATAAVASAEPSRRSRRSQRNEEYASREAPPSAPSAMPTPVQQAVSPPAGTTPEPARTATDAVDLHGPMLVYTGTFHLAVYEVHATQDRIVGAVRALGGFVAHSTDDSLVLRVPAPRFDEAVTALEQAGQVEHRDVKAEDVGEEFRDVTIRIRTLEAMRARVEALLATAHTVPEALAIEQELHRITEELERLKGRERYLADRVAFATINVFFRRRTPETVGQEDLPRLPFGWLDSIGLHYLLPN